MIFEVWMEKRKPQSIYSDEGRYLIAKYIKDHGASQVAKFLKKIFKKYDQNAKAAKACGQSPDEKF